MIYMVCDQSKQTAEDALFLLRDSSDNDLVSNRDMTLIILPCNLHPFPAF